MSGHSKWANIKHKKAAADKKRGKIFGKLSRELTIAARTGGGDPDANPRLRAALDMARSHNMPSDNIIRAIKKGTGELADDTAAVQEVTYEGYGPGGVAILVEAMTDNRNRTTAELRHLFAKHGGNLGEAGCVAWMFERRGFIQLAKATITEDELYEIALDAGADDIQDEGDDWAVYTAPEDFVKVREVFAEKELPFTHAELIMRPKNTVVPDDREAEKVLRLIDALEDHDDVQNVWAAMDLDDELLARISAA